MNAYEPAPGSVPYRVLTWLRQQPPGAEFMSSRLAEGAGVAPEGLTPCVRSDSIYKTMPGVDACERRPT